MSFTTDLDATENTISWPQSENDAPEGWHWGRHVSLGSRGTGYYMIRDADGATLIAIQRPDLSEMPDARDIEDALAGRN